MDAAVRRNAVSHVNLRQKEATGLRPCNARRADVMDRPAEAYRKVTAETFAMAQAMTEDLAWISPLASGAASAAPGTPAASNASQPDPGTNPRSRTRATLSHQAPVGTCEGCTRAGSHDG